MSITKSLKYYPKLNIEKIKKQIMNYDYVSFDLYDTLIKRDVDSPKDVFKLIAKKYYQNEKNNFYYDRIEAEKNVRNNSSCEEIKFDDIYSYLRKSKGYSSKEIKELKELEINIEKNICTVNKEIKEIYDFCLTHNKKILIVSNMYLDKNIITNIISDCNYSNYKLYLSSDILKKKKGTMFNFVLNDLEISSKDLIHIGDSFKSDYLGASKNGIKSILLPKRINKLNHKELNYCLDQDRFFVMSLDSFINNRLDKNKNKYYNFGYESFGILLYEFCKFLHDDLEKKGINNIFFFSRDGYIIKKAYDEIYGNDNKIKSHYLYVSRRALRVPQIWVNSDLEDVVKTLPLAKILTIDIFIKNLGLDPKKYLKQLKLCNLNLHSSIKKKDISSNKNIINFYNLILDDVINNSKKECDILFKYFEQENFKGKVAVVDIGWHGSLQYFIKGLADKSNYDLDMEGYYIGLAKEKRKNIKAYSYVKDVGSDSCDSWKAFNGLCETLFLAQEGSTEKFEIIDGSVKPVLYNYEYGKKEKEANYVKSLQDGAINFIKDFKNSLLKEKSISSFTAFRKIYLTGIKPNRKDLNLFSNFRFLEEQIVYLAKPKSIVYYLFYLNILKKDLFLSRWKIGFMKKLLKINISYYNIYKLLRKISD